MDKNRKNWIFMISLCMVAFIPLIVKGKLYDLNLSQFQWYADSSQGVDIFLYDKMVAVLVVAVLMLLLLGFRLIMGYKVGNLKKGLRMLSALACYLLLMVLSTAFSDYSYFGMHGISEQFESMWVIIGYGIIAFYAYVVARDGNSHTTMDILFTAVGISTVLVGAIGFFQMLGLDPFKSSFVQSLIMTGKLKGVELIFDSSVAEAGRAYSTLYNPNYVGVMACLLIPVLPGSDPIKIM